MAQTVLTRQMMTQYSTGITGGGIPAGLLIRDVPDFIQYMKRQDVPMLAKIPKKGSKKMLIWEYGEGDTAPTEDTLAESLDNSKTDFDVAHGEYFQIWDLVKVQDEVMLVTAITGDNLTVTRGWGSTSPLTSANVSDPIYILGPAVPEGVDAPRSPVTRGETFETYPQILEYTFPMSHRAEVTPNYQHKGNNRQAVLKQFMIEAATDLDNLALNGIKNKGDGGGDSTDNPSTLGGLREATTANVTDLNGDPITFRTFMDAAQSVASDVGEANMATEVMGGYDMKRIWDSWFQQSRMGTLKDGKFKMDWKSVETSLGEFTFNVNYKMKAGELIVWRPEDTGLYHYEGGNWATGQYTTQGWHTVSFLRGDFGFIFEGDRRRFRFEDISLADADYPYLDVPA